MSKKILIVEDENDIRELYSELLVEAGYEVLQAGDGDTGWEMIKNEDWDLLLLDIMLPKKDGLVILEKTLTEPGLKKGPVLVITNLERDSILERCSELGVNEYLVKSNIEPVGVLEAVNKHFPNE